jgi:hypothetical protein
LDQDVNKSCMPGTTPGMTVGLEIRAGVLMRRRADGKAPNSIIIGPGIARTRRTLDTDRRAAAR